MVATLVIGGSEQTRAELTLHLRTEGFEATFVRSGGEGMALLQRGGFELVVLDMVLPDMPGTEVCRRLKRAAPTRDVAVVFVTPLDTEIDRIVAFELGAVDYVAEPFSVRELLLRLRVAVAHKASARAVMPAMASELLALDFDARRVLVRGGEVALSQREFDLLAVMHARQGLVCSRRDLRDQVWGAAAEVSLRTVDASVKRLRRKLGPARHAVETVRGTGYRLRRVEAAPRAVQPDAMTR